MKKIMLCISMMSFQLQATKSVVKKRIKAIMHVKRLRPDEKEAFKNLKKHYKQRSALPERPTGSGKNVRIQQYLHAAYTLALNNEFYTKAFRRLEQFVLVKCPHCEQLISDEIETMGFKPPESQTASDVARGKLPVKEAIFAGNASWYLKHAFYTRRRIMLLKSIASIRESQWKHFIQNAHLFNPVERELDAINALMELQSR